MSGEVKGRNSSVVGRSRLQRESKKKGWRQKPDTVESPTPRRLRRSWASGRPERNSLRLGGVALPVGLILRISSYLLILEVALPQPASARAEPRWSWTGNLGTTRNLIESRSGWYDGSLTASAALLRSAARHLSMGAEVGYHGLGTAFEGVQCGPEWGTDCPGPAPKRIGLWSISGIARWRAGTYRFHPYAVAGAGQYLTAEPVQVSRNGFAVRHHFRPGITAGGGIYGFLPGGIGIEGRWHSILRGDPERRRAALNILSVGVGINIP